MYILIITRDGIDLLNKLADIVEKENRFTKQEGIAMTKLIQAINKATDKDTGSVEINVYKE